MAVHSNTLRHRCAYGEDSNKSKYFCMPMWFQILYTMGASIVNNKISITVACIMLTWLKKY